MCVYVCAHVRERIHVCSHVCMYVHILEVYNDVYMCVCRMFVGMCAYVRVCATCWESVYSCVSLCMSSPEVDVRHLPQ